MLNSNDIQQITANDFEKQALRVFHFQYQHQAIYKQFVDYLKIIPHNILTLQDIPHLPVELFKYHKIITDGLLETRIFSSSGTTGSIVSTHYVHDINLYDNISTAAFETFFEPIASYTILGLLPSYLERSGSSLVHMVQHFMQQSKKPGNGFYLDDFAKLSASLLEAEKAEQPVLLIGVSFALLDFADYYIAEKLPPLKHTMIMETGGMKGRRKELTRAALHQILTNAFGVATIASEYGMTELLSQAYSKENGIFNTPPWMRIQIREINDPYNYLPTGRTGGINVIDLANIYSCAFLQLSDLGRIHPDGSFEVLGRFDDSDVRGCNLLVD